MFQRMMTAAALLAVTFGVSAGQLVIASRDNNYGDAMQYVVERYQQEHPEHTVTLVRQSNSELYDSIVRAMRQQSGRYDVVQIDDTWAPEFIGNHWLEPLSSRLANADFITTLVDTGRSPDANRQLYALPMVGNVAMFGWNRRIFAKYRLAEPKTWSAVLSAAKTISQAGEVSGVVFRNANGNPIVTSFLPILWGYGGDVLDVNGKATLDTPQAKQALDTFLALQPYAPHDLRIRDASEMRDAILNGSAAMVIEVWPAWTLHIDDTSVSKVAGQMAIVAPPTETGKPAPMLGLWQLAIPAEAQHQAAAVDFLAFATSREMQKTLALKFGMPPTRSSLYNDPQLVAKYRWYPQQLMALENGKARPRIRNWAETEAVLGDYLYKAITGQMSSEQALQQAQRDINQVVKL